LRSTLDVVVIRQEVDRPVDLAGFLDAAIAALPEERKGSAVDGIVAAAAKRRDELAARRAGREAGTSAS
jgi:hypothetical protein